MGISRFVSETPGRDKVDGHLMIDEVWKNDLRRIAIFRLGRCTSFQLANKIQFLIEWSSPQALQCFRCGYSRQPYNTFNSRIKLASYGWQARKDSRSRSRRRPAVLRSAHPTPRSEEHT